MDGVHGPSGLRLEAVGFILNWNPQVKASGGNRNSKPQDTQQVLLPFIHDDLIEDLASDPVEGGFADELREGLVVVVLDFFIGVLFKDMNLEVHLALELLPADVARIDIVRFDFPMLGGVRVDLFQMQLQISRPGEDLVALLALYFSNSGVPYHGSTPRLI